MKPSSSHSSDSDDWTLITPPHSSSSSPDREELLNFNELNRFFLQEQPPPMRVEEDGLTEIDLNVTDSKITTQNDSILIGQESGHPSDTDPSIAGFQPLDNTSDEDSDTTSDEDSDTTSDEDSDTTSDEDLNEIESVNQDSRRPSLTQSELGEYVDLSKKDLRDINKTVLNATTFVEGDVHNLEDNGVTTNNDQTIYAEQPGSVPQKNEEAGHPTSIKAMFDDLDEAIQSSNRRVPPRFIRLPDSIELESSFLTRILSNDVLMFWLWVLLWLIVLIVMLIPIHKPNKSSERSINNMPSIVNRDLESKFSFGDSIPTSHQYVELKLLHSELSQCIKRQSPTSFKYYMSEDRFKDYDQSSTKAHSTGKGMNQKPYRGLVCYGQEYQWREKFDRLKSDYDLDLRRLMQEAKRTVTNEMLEFHHPSLQFKLILNQIEYLDFLENKRNRKQSEETIKYLKAENLQLLRRLNQPDDAGYQKVVVNLELQNAKLQRENEALKANLIGKAGPTYIRQSLELEQHERENMMLKQFHHQVAQEVSKSLKQFNLHIIDASTILDDHESLKTQLMLTTGYLRRLSEKIGTVLIENESLKEELKETYLFGAINKENSPSTHAAHYDGSNNANALSSDSCMRDLIDAKEQSNRLKYELNNLKRNCQGNAELEKSSGRHLNKTDGVNVMSNDRFIEQAPENFDSSKTAMEKNEQSRSKQNYCNHQDDSYLANLNADFWSDSNSLTTVESQDNCINSSDEANLQSENKQTINSAKIIPKYIREAVRSLAKKETFHIPEAISYISNLLRTPVYMQLGDDNIENSAIQPANPAPTSIGKQTFVDQQNVAGFTKISDENQRGHKFEHVKVEQLNASSVDNETVQDVGKIDPVTMDFSPGWLFKRAKQRKELRRKLAESKSNWILLRAALRDTLRKQREEPQSEKTEPESNWMLMRATFRETLRKATSYIYKLYIDGVREKMSGKCKDRKSAAQKEDSKQRHNGCRKASKQQKQKNTNNQRNHKYVYHHQEL